MIEKLDGKFHGEIFRNKDNRVEPVDSWIVFVARDNALIPTLEFYYHECKRQGAALPQLEAINELIQRVNKWRNSNPEKCKVPDVEPGELSWEKE